MEVICTCIRIQKYVKDSTHCEIGHFSISWRGVYLWKNDRIFMKIVSQIYLSTTKSPLNFWGHPDFGSGRDRPPLRRSALSECYYRIDIGVFCFVFINKLLFYNFSEYLNLTPARQKSWKCLTAGGFVTRLAVVEFLRLTSLCRIQRVTTSSDSVQR